MAYESNFVTFIGNLVEDPELRFTGGGAAVTSFRMASNRKWKDKNGQEQEEATFLTVNCWRDLAENVAESVTKGDRVIVLGRIRVRDYENKDGVKIYVTELEADEVGPSLRWAKRSAGSPSQSVPPPPSDEDVPF